MTSKLIVALDFDTEQQALQLVDALDPKLCALKVGSEMFTLLGPIFVKQLVSRQFKVFLDLKFHDIPKQVAGACKAAADLGVWMVNVHAAGGSDMMRAAVQALEPFGENKPILIAVTILTSFSDLDLHEIGITKPLIDQVKHLALLAKQAGLDGVVSSAHEVAAIKQLCGSDFISVTPGIRPENSQKDDQTRIITPQYANLCGSDYLVVGRPITQAPDPIAVIDAINASIS